MTRLSKFSRVSAALLLSYNCAIYAAPAYTPYVDPATTPVEERHNKEEKIPPNYFAFTAYKPNYVLPFYYTGSPYNKIYVNNTPNNEKLNRQELKYQISLKVPIWKDIFDYSSNLYFAYTQLSYWQLYNRRAFFRETDYEPELFLANEAKWKLFNSLKLDFINWGADHQSNGFGNTLERSWNRLYLDVIFSSSNWMFSIKPWYVISTNKSNSNITDYLGHGRFLLAYKFGQQVLALQAHNIIEAGAKHATGELTWSFPLTSNLKGYVQVFSGYGQSLIEFNHRTNSAGIGITFNDWI